MFSSGNIAASGGRVQEIAPDGSIVWDFTYVSNDFVSHHDLTLIGDNVLITAYEKKSVSELNAAGFVNANSENGQHILSNLNQMVTAEQTLYGNGISGIIYVKMLIQTNLIMFLILQIIQN